MTDTDIDTSPGRNIRQELKTLADEIRLKVHLAGMEAKDLWKKLEPRVHEFEQKAESVAGEAAAELQKMGSELKEQLDKLRARLGS